MHATQSLRLPREREVHEVQLVEEKVEIVVNYREGADKVTLTLPLEFASALRTHLGSHNERTIGSIRLKSGRYLGWTHTLFQALESARIPQDDEYAPRAYARFCHLVGTFEADQ